MKIQTFAVLKDYFSPELETAEDFETIAALKTYLVQQNPSAQDILDISRFAVNNIFVELDFKINANDYICIIPPSSGG
jgi:molybdopterin synthase sulfur carrier subunit